MRLLCLGFLFILSNVVFAGPYMDCFQEKSKEQVSRLTCEFQGQQFQTIFNTSKRSCAAAVMQEVDRGASLDQLTNGTKEVFESIANEKIASCNLKGSFKFNANGTGGTLIMSDAKVKIGVKERPATTTP